MEQVRILALLRGQGTSLLEVDTFASVSEEDWCHTGAGSNESDPHTTKQRLYEHRGTTLKR